MPSYEYGLDEYGLGALKRLGANTPRLPPLPAPTAPFSYRALQHHTRAVADGPKPCLAYNEEQVSNGKATQGLSTSYACLQS